MDDAVRMRERERGAHVAGDLGGALGQQRPFLSDDVAQRPALDVLHDDVVRAVVRAGVVHADDVRMVQRRGRLCFAAEARDEVRVAGELDQQRLDRDRAAEHTVPAEVYLGHAARTEPVAQLVPAGQHLAVDAQPSPPLCLP